MRVLTLGMGISTNLTSESHEKLRELFHIRCVFKYNSMIVKKLNLSHSTHTSKRRVEVTNLSR